MYESIFTEATLKADELHLLLIGLQSEVELYLINERKFSLKIQNMFLLRC